MTTYTGLDRSHPDGTLGDTSADAPAERLRPPYHTDRFRRVDDRRLRLGTAERRGLHLDHRPRHRPDRHRRGTRARPSEELVARAPEGRSERPCVFHEMFARLGQEAQGPQRLNAASIRKETSWTRRSVCSQCAFRELVSALSSTTCLPNTKAESHRTVQDALVVVDRRLASKYISLSQCLDSLCARS